MENEILSKILMVPAVLIGFTIHEFAHAYVADRLGDKTPKFDGRLTLNPFVHIDIVGFIMILLFQFGWAKPVRTNPTAFKNYYKDDMKVSLAGPFSNLIVAVIFAIITGIISKFGLLEVTGSLSIKYIISQIIYLTAYMNVVLFVLNLIPIPGFDGFHVLNDIFPSKINEFRSKFGAYEMVFIMIFLISPLPKYLVGIPSQIILSGIFKIVFSVF